ncbi:MAG: YkgJ family cysteine cluster protein [Lachnospiraceae bacterium]|nr:YkgJ family cysteine cluster protein [Lachnospiraceae bacterium]
MYICSQCGACCKHLEQSEIYKELDRGDGTCIYLADNKCSIYDERPLVCRVDDCYYIFFKDQMTLEEYYRLNYEACDLLKKKEG